MPGTDWTALVGAVVGGGALTKVLDMAIRGRRGVRAEMQARILKLEGLVDRLYEEHGRMREKAAACEARCELLLAELAKRKP